MMILCTFLLLIALAASGFGFCQRRQRRRTIQVLIDKIDRAMSGRAEPAAYDEALDSLLKEKLNRFLEAQAARQVQAEREKEAVKSLISDITHQTKTPLTNILLQTQLLAERRDLSPAVSAELISISSQADKLNFLIGALVKASYLEGGLIRVQAEREELIPLLEDVLTDQAPVAARAQITLQTVWPDTLDTTCTYDYKWTREALLNLLDNALKYSPAGTAVQLGLERLDSFLRVDVKDFGCGISEAETGKIFTRFYRSPAVAKFPGVGIGLYLARQIAGLQGGYLKVRSQPGRGSTFSLYLPL